MENVKESVRRLSRKGKKGDFNVKKKKKQQLFHVCVMFSKFIPPCKSVTMWVAMQLSMCLSKGAGCICVCMCVSVCDVGKDILSVGCVSHCTAATKTSHLKTRVIYSAKPVSICEAWIIARPRILYIIHHTTLCQSNH